MKTILFSIFSIFTLTVTSQNLQQGLVTHYTFDQTANDETGNNYHLNGSNIQNYIPFASNDSAYYLNGSSRLIQSNTFNNTSFSSTSVSMWIKPEVGPTGTGTMIQAAYAGFAIYIHYNTGTAGAFFTGQAAGNETNSTINIVDSNWHHLVALNTGTQTRVYIDGILSATRNQNLVTSTGSVAQKKLYIGSTNLNLHLYRGGINDLRIYNRVLTQAEITMLATFPGTTNLESATIETPQLTIYPNPTSGVVNLKSNTDLTGSRLIVRNMLGQTIQNITVTGNTANFSIEGEDGIYFVEFNTRNGERIVKKVIKQ